MNYIPCFVLIRLLFPLSLAACVVLRQNFISFIYLLLFLYSPWIHIPSSKSMAGATGRYLQVVIACSVLTNLAQITFQIVVLSLKSYSDITENCDFLEKLLRHIGFVSLKNVYWRDGFQAMSPDPLILFVSIIVYVLSNHLVLERRVSWPNMGYMLPEYKYVNASKRRFFFYLRWGKYVVLLSFCIAALIQPSVVGGVYFLVFIGGVTWWSLYRKMEKPFGIILHCISVVIALHIVAWFSMQLQWIQEYTRTCDVCRYLGLKPLVKVNCTNPYSMNLVDEETATFISPIFLFWLYIMVVLYGRLLKRLKKLGKSIEESSESLHKDFIRMEMTSRVRRHILETVQRQTRSYGNVQLIQGHRIGKVVQPAYYHRESFVVTRPQSVHEESFPNEEGSGIPESEHKWSYMAKFGDFLYGGLQLLCRNLFILTTITMIAWSITYHSWLTFVLLLWASIIWLIPNQRQAMLRSSPFLVFYAICLLIIQYIYSLDLTNYERPNDFRGINLNQMGLSESSGHPSGPLAVKCLYTLVFWLTLRQLMEEKAAKRISAKMQAGKFPSKAKHPLERQPSKTYTVMTEVGNFMKNLLTKFCTWLVAIFLFLIGISGDRVTIFRIIYTAFFLVFVFAFQVSYTFWRKMLYGFWLTVIVYSMSILVLIYTYQFDNFDSYWENLGISATLQLDIGLEKYKTGELFIRLLIPTTTLIIAVLQMHYFHKDFLENSDIKRRISRLKSVQPSNELNPDTGYTNDDLKEEGEKERVIPTSQDASGSRTEVGETGKSPFQHINEFIEYVWLFMELHITKITLLCVFMLCIFDVCALHFIIVLLVVIAIPFGAHIHLFIANVCSVYSGALLLARMIYQIKYINHSIFVVNCTNLIEFDFPLRHYDRHISVNNMEWGGLLKADASQPFFSLIKGYIGVIFIVTFMAAVNIRQEYKRCLLPQPSKKQEVMFPNITRAEADDNITNCIKYLLNYVFYKFGVEICLMGLMAVIGIRMDFYAVLYCFWLCSLFALKRQTLMKVWTCFQIFIMVLILMQFALLVGLPPGLCIEYPWYSSITMRYTQEWMMLPDPLYPPSTYKVMFDFVLLILVNRQHVVFRIENAEGPDYPGGSNMDISDKIDDPDYINTVPDHVSQFRSWLDLMKRGILSSVMWVTLAIVFLAGANRVNIFSIGYLIGSFTFLWQGEDFYLRPLKVILTWWNTLIGYNVVVIAIKVLLQIVGCIFMESASDNACWAVQVLGIACIKKFGKDFHSSGVIESQECVISREGAGMAWDGVCFGFLIMICRLFKSHYFIHLVNETKAMTILASRGAELIQALHKKQIEVQQEGEYKILDKIKIKMEKIKAAQMKVQGHGFKEPAHHYAAPLAQSSGMSSPASPQGYHTPINDNPPPLTPRAGSLLQTQAPTPCSAIMTVSLDGYLEPQRISFGSPPTSELLPRAPSLDDSFPVFSPPPYGAVVGRRTSRRQSSIGPPWLPNLTTPRQSVCLSSPQSHHESTRSGDYYMFEEYDDDLLEVDKFEEEPVEEAELMVQRSRRMTLSQLLTSALKTDIGTATDLARSKSSYDPLLLGQRRSSFFSAQSQISGLTGRRDSTTSRSDMAVGSPESASRRIPRVDEVDEEEPTKESSDSLPRDDSSDVLRSSASTWKTYLMFAWAFIESAMVSLTDCFNDHSKDYRYIIMALAVEKKLLKRNRDFGRGYRTGSGKIWQPTYGLTSRRQGKLLGVPQIRVLAPSMERGLDSNGSSHDHTHTLEEMEKIYGLKDSEQHSIVRLVIATWFAVISNSEFMCYFTVFLHQIKSASIFSLPLPLMVFLWGTFSVPRPTKNFWVTIIAYTEVMVIVKCMFQFELIPWNQQLVPGKDPFFPPRILGIEQKPYYAAYDLVLLLVVFFHRFMLKSLGLWKSSYAEVKEELNEGEDFYYQTKDDDESKSTIMHSTHEVTGNNSMGNVPSLILVKREEEEPCENFPHILLMTTARYFDAVRTFFEDLLSNTRRVTVDIYAYMFLCDFFNFMVLLFGFASFGSAQSEGGVASYLQENKVPTPFLVMLILQFGLIVIDRGLYLRKNILGKIIFQFFLVFGVHIWMFFVLPAVTERPFHDSLPPQMWYMMKCFYLLFSAYQIRCGYPTRILGNFVCKRYNIINMILFKGFMTAPFLFELRALMDWIWTDTSMTLWDWLKMEDIFNGIYELKCTRRLENEYPQERGTRKYPLTKYLMGGGLLIGIIGFIWFPLVLFALGNTVGLTNIPNDITLSLRIGPYPPIYKMSVQNASIFQFNEKEWNYMLNYYKRNRKAQVFLSNYGHKDVAVAWFDRNSSSVWDITPPDQKRMIEMVDSDNPVEVKLTWTVLRYSNNPMYPEEISGSVTITLEPIVEGRRNPHRNELVKMLAGNGTAKPIFIQEIFPKFIAVTNHGRTSPVTHLMSGSSTSEQSLRSLHLNLFHDSYGNLKSTQEWWEVTEDINDDNYRSYLKNIPKANGDYIVLYTFSDKAFPEQFTFFFFGGAQGIIGLYLSIVALVAKILRSLIFGCTSTIMFVELPCVDRVLQLCLDIYLVRESKEYALEEDLYAKLIFLYRSPETLIKWTRFRDDETEDQPESYARPMLES